MDYQKNELMSSATIPYSTPQRKRIIKNRLFQYLIIFLTIITVSPIILIIGKLVQKGYRQINLNFFTETTPDTFEAMSAIANNELIPGGILNGISGTLIMIGLASIIAIPISFNSGYHNFPKGSFQVSVRTFRRC